MKEEKKEKEKVSSDIYQLRTTGLGNSNKFSHVCLDLSGVENFY